MTDLNNKLNLNNVRSTSYTPNVKGEEEAKPAHKTECENCAVKGDGTRAAESYGRVLVKQAGKIENPETVQCVKDAVDAFLKDPYYAAAQVRSIDDAYELNEADGIECPYENACCGIGDAACESAARRA